MIAGFACYTRWTPERRTGPCEGTSWCRPVQRRPSETTLALPHPSLKNLKAAFSFVGKRDTRAAFPSEETRKCTASLFHSGHGTVPLQAISVMSKTRTWPLCSRQIACVFTKATSTMQVRTSNLRLASESRWGRGFSTMLVDTPGQAMWMVGTTLQNSTHAATRGVP
jgi:hypothetical protein